jgi:hypothetical protein
MSSEHSLGNVSSVEETISRVMSWFPGKFKDVNVNHIQVVFRDSLNSPWRATIRVVSGLLAAFTNRKLVLVVWKGNWEGSDEYQRSLLVYEQLLRVRYDDEKKKYQLRKHDVQTFQEILADFGLNYEKTKEVFDAVRK